MFAFWNENQMVEYSQQQQQEIYTPNFEILRGKYWEYFDI